MSFGITASSVVDGNSPGGDSPYANAVLNESPLVYLPLNEMSGTTAMDISGNSHNATYSGASLFLGGYSIVSGSTGRSAWAGGADLITVPYGAWMDTSGMTVLFSCFARPAGIVLWAARYASDGDLSQDAWFVDIGAGGTFELWFHTSDGTSIRVDSGMSPIEGTRYCVAAYVGASESGIRVYSENGTLVGANTGVGGSLNMPSADITLFGMGGTTVYGAQGCLDDFSLFDHALTTTRLDELAALALAANESWINKTEGTGVRNGTDTHTLTFAPASAGSLLVAVMGGSVTHTAVTAGWTKQINALDDTELAVFTHTATGGETTFDVTHNGTNFPIAWVVYEFPVGSSYHSGSSVAGGAPTSELDLAGLPGSKVTVMVVQNSALLPTATALNTNWRFYWETDANLNVLNDGTTDGTWLNVGYFAHNDFPDTTVSVTDTSLNDGMHYEQAILFAIQHP